MDKWTDHPYLGAATCGPADRGERCDHCGHCNGAVEFNCELCGRPQEED